MARIQPLTALHYDLDAVGPLQDLVAPPYDVIDAQQREQLVARSPYNVVEIDLPTDPDAAPPADTADAAGTADEARQQAPYDHAAATLRRWIADGAVVQDTTPAIWALTQDYRGPDGAARTRSGFLCRVRVEDYGAGRIRPHERTHPGPKEDRLRLTRATRANLSPIFSLYSDPGNSAWNALEPHTVDSEPIGAATDEDGTVNRLWRVADPQTVEQVVDAVAPAELLIADGHHRYETARAYAQEVGLDDDGPHRWVLMCLVALEDPGLTVFPTHRLIAGPLQDAATQERLALALRADFDVTPLDDERQLVPTPAADGHVQLGYMDSRFKRPFLLTLRDPQATVGRLLQERSEPYRRLDTAVLESLILKGPLGFTDHAIDSRDGLLYARDFDEALGMLHDGTAEAGFFMGATPIRHVQEVAAAGESMPPKSTFFFPKVPTGLVFNPLFA